MRSRDEIKITEKARPFIIKCKLIFLIIFLFSSCEANQEKPEPVPTLNPGTVTIDGTKEYQTIEGLGGTEMYLFPAATEYSRFFEDLGVSMVRFRMVEYVESVPGQAGNEARDNDNNDAFMINWDNVKTDWFAATRIPAYLQAAQQYGCKIMGSIMSYPPWMKTNNVTNGGYLKSGYEDEAVEFILIWIEGLQKYAGVHVDYVSFENEPNWEHPYEGTALSTAQVVRLTKKLGDRLISEGLDTKIVPAEPSAVSYLSGIYGPPICNDSDAKGHVYALTTHCYQDNDFFNPDVANPYWDTCKKFADGCGKPLWMTEYCLDNDAGLAPKGSWLEAIYLVQHVHNALTRGYVTTWLYHELYNDPSKTPVALVDKDNPTIGTFIYPKFYALKQYFKYVRPGAIRINARSPDNNILVTAFNNKEDRTLTIIIINRKKTKENFAFDIRDFQGISNLQAIRTSQNEKAANLGFISVSGGFFSYALPAESITTFIGVYSVAVSAAKLN